MVMQFGQKSATTYVARKEAGISSVADMAGHSVGPLVRGAMSTSFLRC